MKSGPLRSAARQIVSRTPPGVRRTLWGLWADLNSVPARVRDPARWGEPWSVVHNVGDGDYRQIGEEIAVNLTRYAGLAPCDRVLDIGCGNGRAAGPLAAMLDPARGGYIGFDVSRRAIEWCRRHYRDQPHLRFEHLDVWNGDYNREGAVAEAAARFPAADGLIDVAFAASVFTHMRFAGVTAYMAEASRVLKPGGRFAFTAFTLEPERSGPALFDFGPFDETSQVVDPRSPERAIAHLRPALEAAVGEAGLILRSFHRGRWRAPSDYDWGQDLWVVEKA